MNIRGLSGGYEIIRRALRGLSKGLYRVTIELTEGYYNIITSYHRVIRGLSQGQ